jgi:hypothetical protein
MGDMHFSRVGLKSPVNSGSYLFLDRFKYRASSGNQGSFEQLENNAEQPVRQWDESSTTHASTFHRPGGGETFREVKRTSTA